MSKKTPAKKSKRRLKRSVRRSLAAVLMITAIGVAAIPVPENAAAPNDGTTPDDSTNILAEYAYPDDLPSIILPSRETADDGSKITTPETNADGSISEPTYRNFYISKTSGGNDTTVYTMNWQFQFFMRDIAYTPYGIICGYNYPAGRVETLTVPKNPIYEYATVTPQEFEQFKEDELTADNVVVTLTRPNLYPEEDAKFIAYFGKESYDAYVAEFNRIQKIIDSWNPDDHDATDPNDQKPAPHTITKKTSDFTLDSQWRRYYCDIKQYRVTFETQPDPNDPDSTTTLVTRTISLKGYALAEVVDAANRPDGVSNGLVYIPKKLDGAETDGDVDENGFLIKSRTTFIGIADNTFKGVSEIDNVELDNDIHYIGDSAFEGSFIKSISTYAETIGNRAFYNCRYLATVNLQEGVKRIGTEAFFGEPVLREMVFPASMEYIGLGSFARCTNMAKLDFSKMTFDTRIDDYAFYNNVALNSVNFIQAGTENAEGGGTPVGIDTIGKAAFAVTLSVTGGLEEFVFPSGIFETKEIVVDELEDTAVTRYQPFPVPRGSSTTTNANISAGYTGLGDFVLAGRTNLKDVTMPSNFGSTQEAVVPDHLFHNCISLGRVKFPHDGNTCGMVSYNSKVLFITVSNPDFYVEGPERLDPSLNTPAKPRTSTWSAITSVSKVVPYVYYIGDTRYTEVSDGDYLMCVDQNGVLIDCKLNPTLTEWPEKIHLVIPANVANTPVTGIASDCFKDEDMNALVVSVTIKDGSQLATINDSVFAGWPKLQKAYIGDSVRTVGANAFAGCNLLIDVTFNTPESAAAAFEVKANAFQTGSAKLTFHGMINPDFWPYKYAMDPGNVIDENSGRRICYKSLAPSYLTVMFGYIEDKDSEDRVVNPYITLLDYPKYNQVPQILGDYYATKNGVDWKEEGFRSAEAYYRELMENTYYDQYRGSLGDAGREAFRQAWAAASNPDEVYRNLDVYGPWIYPGFTLNEPAQTPEPNPGGDETGSIGESLFDFFFEPITAYALGNNATIVPYFDYEYTDSETHERVSYHYDVQKNYERGMYDKPSVYGPYMSYTMDEYNMYNATRNLTLPDGITSIDVKGYMDTEENESNRSGYLTGGDIGYDQYRMYYLNSGTDASNRSSVIAGLFSGDYNDGLDGEGEPDETTTPSILSKGNDCLESINLNQVTYLPDYAFDSCERLRSVTIGKACMDIGALPFRACKAMTTINVDPENTKYLSDNKILYSKNGDAAETFTVEECLEARGENDNVNKVVHSGIDANLASVTRIANGAFEDCNNLISVNFSDLTGLTELPINCFNDCDTLGEVSLPSSVNKIERNAFAENKVLSNLSIPGREVFISTQAFTPKDVTTMVHTYPDSAARRYADTYQDQYNLLYVEMDEVWSVKFYDLDGMLIKEVSVTNGESMKRDDVPNYRDYSKEGYQTRGWIGTGGITTEDAITMPTVFTLDYISTSTMVDGKYVVKFFDGITGEQIGKDQLVEPGGAAVEPQAPDHTDSGYKFIEYHVNEGLDLENVKSNIDAIALYELINSGTNKPGSGTTSGGTTNTSGGTTNTSRNTTSTSGTSTSTSGSSTSTTSSSSEAAGKYTVTVINGSGSGDYTAGSTVIIAANTPATGKKFLRWTTESQGVTLASVSLSATTFKMPANNVTITAEYTDDTGTPTSGTVTTTPTSTGGGSTATPAVPDNGNTRVDITKPGISNRDLATANVNGSTDNFIVKISETPEATQAVMNALTNKYGNLDNILYYAMDISLYDSTGTTKISDTTGLTVDITIPLPDALITYGGNNMMGAVVSNQLEDLSERFTTINGVPCISFTATHFSPYTVYVNTQNLSEGLLDTTPKTGDPIHPKWFLSLGLACLSVILFMKKDKRVTAKKVKA